jgi:L-lysine 2,3-aminomutase
VTNDLPTDQLILLIQTGINLMAHLRGKLSGIAIPTFIVDLPNGGGKVPVYKSYIEEQSDENIVFNIIQFIETQRA